MSDDDDAGEFCGAKLLDVSAHGTQVDRLAADRNRAILVDHDALSRGFELGVDRVGLLTVTPACFTKTAVMMKKMSRFTTKSSIGARSMPCDQELKSTCRLSKLPVMNENRS